ncbi:membrane protein, partial [Xanthomonas oryzae pv. oryzae]
WVWWWRDRQRQRRWLAAFDAQLQRATTPAQRLAAASVLLRRAARRVDPQADRLQGDAWLQFLDGRKSKDRVFSQGPGRAMLEGGFQRAPAVRDLPAVEALARQRFVALMRGRR